MRAFMLTVTGLVFSVAACSSYGTSTVEVKNPAAAKVASVSINIPLSLLAGQTARATAVAKDAEGNALSGRTISWFSSSTSVASVDDSGTISAISPGSAVLSAVSEGVAGQGTMSVVPPPPTPIATLAVLLNPSAVTTGQTATATATAKDSSGNVMPAQNITWESSNVTVATVTTTGSVKAVGRGTAMIKASSGGKSAASALNVTDPAPVPVASVAVTPATASIQTSGTVQLSAVTRDANNNLLTGRLVSWTSSATGVATVSSSGLVTAVAAGSATITASSEGQQGTSAITVTAPAPVPVATVSVSPASNSLQVGGTVTLSAVTRDANNNVLTGRVISWTSSATAVATVSSSGVVTAVGAGTATITATSEGQRGTASVTVTAPAPVPVASVSVTPASASVQAGGTVALSAVTRDASGNVLTGRAVAWSSNNLSAATVSGSGQVTAVAAGSATITATSEGVSGTSAITVTAPPPPPPSGSVEPAGLTTLTERPFSALNEDGWTNTGSSYYTIQSDASAPQSPSSIGQIKFPAGFGSGNAPAVLEKVWSSPVKTLYVSFWLKLSSNWVGNDASVNKIFHFWIGDSNRLFLNAHGAGNGTLTAEVWLQRIVAGGNYDAGTTANFAPNLGASAQIVRGQWVHWEMLFTGNSSGTADGKVEWWINGQKVGSYSGIQFVTGAGLWQEMEWSPTYGGFGNPVPADQFMSVDHIRVSGK
ncbi:MAG TPA: Ig-like domain-containing protein [Gemmatimonadaceae bacterium]|nr:Ig-like domain-containing protein [Gemmatimonadaceae bacterium]